MLVNRRRVRSLTPDTSEDTTDARVFVVARLPVPPTRLVTNARQGRRRSDALEMPLESVAVTGAVTACMSAVVCSSTSARGYDNETDRSA
jgi:hypothetical protein